MLLLLLMRRWADPCGKGSSSRKKRYGRTSIGTRSRTEAGTGSVVVPVRVVVVPLASAPCWAAWSFLYREKPARARRGSGRSALSLMVLVLSREGGTGQGRQSINPSETVRWVFTVLSKRSRPLRGPHSVHVLPYLSRSRLRPRATSPSRAARASSIWLSLMCE